MDEQTKEQLLLELIPVLETLEEPERLRRALASTPPRPAARLRAGLAWLSLAEYDRAARSMSRLIKDETTARRALHVLVAAAALGGRATLARRALRRLEETQGGVDPELMTACWQRGLTGRMLQRSTGPSDRPAGSLLRTMVRRAKLVFDQALAEGPLEEAERVELERHQAVCLAVLRDSRARSA